MSTRSRALSPPNKCTTRDGSLKGRLRRKRSLIKLKMAVFGPIPRASVMTAIEVNAGDCEVFEKRNEYRSYHSVRKAMMGSTREARRAGIQQATTAAQQRSKLTVR